MASQQWEYLASIEMTAFPFGLSGYAFCNGVLMPISQNTALFSVIGSLYGGDGRVTFALPDMRSRMPVGVGQGPGLTPYTTGQINGTESVALTNANLPEHMHEVSLGGTGTGPFAVAGGSAAAGSSVAATLPAGEGQPVPIVPPVLAVPFQINLNGIFPVRP